MRPSVIEYLQHILDETDYLLQSARGLDKDDFMSDETLKRAYVRSLEVIGEAAKQLPKAVTDNYPHVEWRLIAGMRDRLIHGYFGVDYDIVWDVVSSKMRQLNADVRRIIDEQDNQTSLS